MFSLLDIGGALVVACGTIGGSRSIIASKHKFCFTHDYEDAGEKT
jgi:hypothetical protein